MIDDEVHPIYHTPLSKAFPWLCCCITCWPKASHDGDEEEKPEQNDNEY